MDPQDRLFGISKQLKSIDVAVWQLPATVGKIGFLTIKIKIIPFLMLDQCIGALHTSLK